MRLCKIAIRVMKRGSPKVFIRDFEKMGTPLLLLLRELKVYGVYARKLITFRKGTGKNWFFFRGTQ